MSDNSLRSQIIRALRPFIDQRCRTDEALDVVLGFLTDNAEAWRQAAYEKFPETDPDMFGAAAIAVLRETTKSSPLPGKDDGEETNE